MLKQNTQQATTDHRDNIKSNIQDHQSNLKTSQKNNANTDNTSSQAEQDAHKHNQSNIQLELILTNTYIPPPQSNKHQEETTNTDKNIISHLAISQTKQTAQKHTHIKPQMKNTPATQSNNHQKEAVNIERNTISPQQTPVQTQNE